MNDFVIFRQPNQQNIQLLQGDFQAESFSKLGTLNPGFLLSEFDASEKLYWLQGHPTTIEPPSIVSFENRLNLTDFEGISDQKEKYISEVIDLVQEMNRPGTLLKKVVLANQRFISGPYSAISLFHQLLDNNPNAFCYLVSSKHFGVWIGASPELLVEKKQDNTFHTVALAGTLSHETQEWTSKEKEEQQMVSDFIALELQQLGLNYDQSAQREIQSGRLKHLLTEFKIPGQAQTKNLFESILQQLHPTPAVAGLPRKQALDLIKVKEPLGRQLYAGLLGVVGTQQSRINVNLRCARLYSNGVLLFAGAGLTKSSNAAAEYEETQRKMRVIEDLLY